MHPYMSRLFEFQASASSKMYMARATQKFFRVGDVKSKTISLGHLKVDLVFATNSNFLMPISLQPDNLNL